MKSIGRSVVYNFKTVIVVSEGILERPSQVLVQEIVYYMCISVGVMKVKPCYQHVTHRRNSHVKFKSVFIKLTHDSFHFTVW